MNKMIKLSMIGFIIVILFTTTGSFASEETELPKDFFKKYGSVMLIIDTSNGHLVDANVAAEKFYGYSRNELLNMKIDQINQLSPEQIKIEMTAAELEKRNYFIFEHRLKNGEIKHVEVYSYPYITDDGRSLLFSIVHDITPRTIAENQAHSRQIVIVAILILFLLGVLVVAYLINRSKKALSIVNQELKNLFDNMEEGFALHEIILDEHGIPDDYRFIDMNDAFQKLTGLKRDEIRGMTVKEAMPDTESYWIEKYGEVALTGKPLKFVNYSKALDKHFSVSVYSPLHGQFATIFTDITDQKNLESELRAERSIFKTTLHSLSDGVLSIDDKGKIKLMNAVAENLTGWTLDEASGDPFDEIFKIEQQDRDRHEADETNEFIIIRKDGTTLPVEASAATIIEENGTGKGTVLVFRDITERKNKQEKILYLSYHDQLTGLYNRRFFEEELKRLDTERNLPITIAMVDVNGLKLTNDAFGHTAGDELLTRVSNILKHECRTDDIIARIGGDEFVILLPKTSWNKAEGIVDRIKRAMAEEKMENIIVSASIGWDTKSVKEQLMTEMFANAEAHMYQNKLTETQIMRNNTIHMIQKTLNERNHTQKIHGERVGLISLQLARAAGLDGESLQEIGIVASMHDIGKITVSNALLEKPEALSEDEFEEIKRHVESGYQILKSADDYVHLADYVLSHHERWDGTGYPRALKGEEIPKISRIIAIADAYEAMTSKRPYKEMKTKEEAIQEIKECSGTQFDPDLVIKCEAVLWDVD